MMGVTILGRERHIKNGIQESFSPGSRPPHGVERGTGGGRFGPLCAMRDLFV